MISFDPAIICIAVGLPAVIFYVVAVSGRQANRSGCRVRGLRLCQIRLIMAKPRQLAMTGWRDTQAGFFCELRDKRFPWIIARGHSDRAGSA